MSAEIAFGLGFAVACLINSAVVVVVMRRLS